MEKTVKWTEKEVSLIKETIGERCIDFNNKEDDEVNVIYYARGYNNVQVEVTPDWMNPKFLHYTVVKYYRNSHGDIIDDEVLEHIQRPRLTKYLKTFLGRIIAAYDLVSR
jgi:hypothetical protein